MGFAVLRDRIAVGILPSLSLVTALLVGGAPATAEAVANPPPNVLIIVTDDQRAEGTLSVMPALRSWFGGSGKRFKTAFATTPTCCPSRASIFTGQYAHNHGVMTSQPGEADNLDQSRTMQHQLKQLGYTTALFGKYLNGWDVNEAPPDFDRWAMISDISRYFYRGGMWNLNGSVRRVHTYSTVFIQRQAQRFIRAADSKDDRPWMMVLTPLAPHIPATPQRRDRYARIPKLRPTPAMLEKDRSDKPDFARGQGPSLASMRALRARQLRTLMSVDRMVEAVRTALLDSGELTNTVAIFTSDNGLMWGEHGLTDKGVAYEPAVRVPLMMTWPGKVPGGVVDQRLVANIDIAPTVYEAVGVTPALPVDGRSLLGSYDRSRILLEHWKRTDREQVDWAAHRTHDYKYIETYLADHVVFDWREYYGLGTDPWELTNRISPTYIGTNPDVTQLRADLVCVGTEGPTACP